MSQQWDYQTLEGQPEPTAILAACQEEGKQGWELCNALIMVKGFGGQVLKGINLPPPQPVALLVFKRPTGWQAPASDEEVDETADPAELADAVA